MRIRISTKPSPNSFIQQSGVAVDPDLPISFAFGLVSQTRGWKIGSKRWRKAWNACMNAEYNRLIGSRLNSLETWQELCAKVGITEVFPSITKCKKALAKVNVNIVDLLDCWDTPNLPKQFKSRHALSNYTRDNHKFFGRAIAKQDKALKVLLRQLV
ncbi:hypothetical protein N7541_007201 [Penicillium brevicompactum]|uniref:Uncharacterized protein n=1 Tax=Penicillium brevicompactum TaxID=5074 RepID=A0A9W9QZP5_PENBR|nr:hypothetical protein N7541_007201 [Penicillium brevicompactum]